MTYVKRLKEIKTVTNKKGKSYISLDDAFSILRDADEEVEKLKTVLRYYADPTHGQAARWALLPKGFGSWDNFR